MELKESKNVSIDRACQVMNFARSMWYYKSRKDDSLVENKLKELSESLPTRGFGSYYGRIRNEGLIWNHKRVKRVYDKLGLNIRRRKKEDYLQERNNPFRFLNK